MDKMNNKSTEKEEVVKNTSKASHQSNKTTNTEWKRVGKDGVWSLNTSSNNKTKAKNHPVIKAKPIVKPAEKEEKVKIIEVEEIKTNKKEVETQLAKTIKEVVEVESEEEKDNTPSEDETEEIEEQPVVASAEVEPVCGLWRHIEHIEGMPEEEVTLVATNVSPAIADDQSNVKIDKVEQKVPKNVNIEAKIRNSKKNRKLVLGLSLGLGIPLIALAAATVGVLATKNNNSTNTTNADKDELFKIFIKIAK